MKLLRNAAREVAIQGRTGTLVDVLLQRVEELPDRTVFTFIPEGRAQTRELTFRSLLDGARAVAIRLQQESLRGERAVLLYPAGLEFVEAFFGCLMAGVVAVPAPPPGSRSSLSRLAALAMDAGAVAALAPSALVSRYRGAVACQSSLAQLRWIATDEERDSGGIELSAIRPGADSLAYLQYTSGSTSEPKGVMVGHGNLTANSEEIRRGFAHSTESRSLSWLPHFHDMGLVDGILQPVYSGFHGFLMSPSHFLQNPAAWLEAISQRGISHSGAPNFAYDLCAQRVDPDPARLDLRCWRVAYNGAEPVRAASLERFASRFSACGFRRQAFYPAYGLAEATLKVSGGSPGEGARVVHLSRAALDANRAVDDDAGQALVGAGRPGPGTRVEIVDPDTGLRRLEGAVGEIWVSGPSVAQGYWNRIEETQRVFGARLQGDPS
ncbi:MAG TPA: fatty acyl-AMP ligase, partial [Candidatus Polarisedimenticolia bacterium]|nr:fatty acyl-AMP ligase [Candidatus Polarisedimenticolia bacterium]